MMHVVDAGPARCVTKAPMRVLHLTLEKRWFDLIADGEKVFEYREYKPHWQSRLIGKSGARRFDEVRFVNGYGQHRPFARCEFVGVTTIAGECCDPQHGEQLETDQLYFVIGLGRVLEVGNLNSDQ